MKKLFISQPMDGKTNEEILKVREEAIQEAKCIFGDEKVTVIDSFIKNAPHDANPLWYLGQSILLLATADAAFFAKGWRNTRGCVIENVCANEYGILTIETN